MDPTAVNQLIVELVPRIGGALAQEQTFLQALSHELGNLVISKVDERFNQAGKNVEKMFSQVE